MTGQTGSYVKITRPKLSEVVKRNRLFSLLDRGRNKPVIWVSSPAGSGKTTLLASYLDARKLPCIWYQVDEGDADIATFFYYMGLAAKKAAPRHKKPMPLLSPEYMLGIPTFTRRFFETLCSRLKQPFSIIFDNYQNVPEGAAFHELITAGIEAVSPGISVIILSRRGPAKPFARLQANNAMAPLGWDDMRLTYSESKAIVKLRSMEKVSEDIQHKLYSRTQGWTAGLVLTVESAKAGKLYTQSVREKAPEEIFSYFAGELLRDIDKQKQDFLLMTALLPKITPQTGERLTGNKHSGQILAELSRNNNFTDRRSLSEATYQYHPLLREFLLQEGERVFSRAAINELKQKAAMIQIEEGQIEDAAGLFIAAEDWQGLIQLILENAQLFIMQGRSKTLQEWIAFIPEELFERVPWLFYWKGYCRLFFNPGESQSLFERAFKLFSLERSEALGIFLSWAGIIDAIEFAAENFRELDIWIEQLYELTKQFGSPPGASGAKIASAMFTALVMRQPRHPDFQLWREKALAQTDARGKIHVLYYDMFYQVYTGNGTGAIVALEAMRELAESPDFSPGDLIGLKHNEIMLNIHLGLFDAGLKAAAEGLELADKSGIHIYDFLLLGLGALTAVKTGDFAKASELKKRMPKGMRLWDKSLYDVLLATEAHFKGDYRKASIYSATALNLVRLAGVPYSAAITNLLNAWIMHRLRNRQEAEARLREAAELVEKFDQRFLEFDMHLIMAHIALEQEKTGQKGLNHLKKALSTGRGSGLFCSCFLWDPSELSHLCAIALENDIEIGYVQQLIQKHNLLPGKMLLHIENWPWPMKIYTLGNFELARDGRQLEFTGKTQKKPLELLKLLISSGGKEVSVSTIADTLWPEAEGDSAYSSFTTTLSRLRKLVGDKAVRVHEGKAAIDARYCWTDILVFEHNLSSAKELWKAGEAAGALRLMEKALGLYKGHFLANDVYPWAAPLRERARNRFLDTVLRLGRHYEDKGDWEGAAEFYFRGTETDNLAEEFYQGLMTCYFRQGHRTKAIRAYAGCREALSLIMGIEPSAKTEEIYNMILAG